MQRHHVTVAKGSKYHETSLQGYSDRYWTLICGVYKQLHYYIDNIPLWIGSSICHVNYILIYH